MKYLIMLIAMAALMGCAHGHKKGHGECKECKKAHWMKMDTDSDGKVSKDEYMKFKTDSWAEMDADKDGFVTMEEKKAYKKSMKKTKCKKCGA